MQTIDFKKDPTYKAKTSPQIVTIPPMTFVMVDGHGAPESKDDTPTEFQEAFGIIYGIVYTIKFWDKKHPTPPGYAKFSMPPAEALWYMADGSDFDMTKPSKWSWTLMHRVPDFVSPQYFGEVVAAVSEQKKSDVFKRARLQVFEEGECVQIMHIGPYSEEAKDIATMHQYAKEQGYRLHGKHHELYFGDPRRSAPEKLKTILRQPVFK